MAALLLAHQGGWDEILLVLAPIGLLALVLRMAQRRAVRLAETHTTPVPGPETVDDAPSLPPGDSGPEH